MAKGIPMRRFRPVLWGGMSSLWGGWRGMPGGTSESGGLPAVLEGAEAPGLGACSRSVASNGKVLPFDPMSQILRCPGPSEGMGKGFVVFPDTGHDMVIRAWRLPQRPRREAPSHNSAGLSHEARGRVYRPNAWVSAAP